MAEVLQKIISNKFTSEVLRNIIKKKTGLTDFIVKNVKIGDGTKKGESYLSVTTRFTVVISDNLGNGDQNHEIHVITKSLPDNIPRRKTLRSTDFFRNEISFYSNVWTALQEFQKSKNLKDNFDPIPLCLASFCNGEDDFIAMEDLSYQGYSSMARTSGLDYPQTIEIIRVFGKFHALSLAFKDQHADEFIKISEALEETYYDEKFRCWYEPVFKKFCSILKDAVEKELESKYLSKLDEILERDDLYGDLVKATKRRDVNLLGVTQGDCWAPNFMVKTCDGRTDVKIIDYQLSRIASLTMDLSFFLYTCVTPSILAVHFDDFLKEYRTICAERLKELGSNENLITLEFIREDMRKTGLFIFGMTLEGGIMSQIDEEDVVDLDDIKKETTMDNVWILKLIPDKERRQRVAGVFRHLVDQEFI